MNHPSRFRVLVAAATLFTLLAPLRADAYIGPGAGFAFVSSFLILFVTIFLAFLTMLTWPLRWAWQTIRGRRATGRGRARRVVIVGLDGQDPELTEKYLNEGLLPNFQKLRDEGSFARLQTTLLAESPVAWSSFQVGANPGVHRIFDFLAPNRKSYLPELSSAHISPPARSIRIGKYVIPFGKPRMRFGRKSQPFWKILGDHGIFSTILRVPITFPPEKFNGVMLSAMCVPDLKGSQGTYYYYSSDTGENLDLASGVRIPVEWRNNEARSYISGPENSMREGGGEMRIEFEVRKARRGNSYVIFLNNKHFDLRLRDYTPWIELDFSAAPGIKVRGIVRFYLIEAGAHLKLYMTPIQIDPAKPALPISHPMTYSIYLAKTLGPFATLGVAEDTSALNEGVVDEDCFLNQTWLIHEERERMLFDAIDKTRRGCVVCVFDATDRIQHMFFRTLDADHPANRGREVEKYRDTIRDLYVRMDDLIGRVRANLDDDTVLMVMSDHGFKPFKRAVNLNTWLWKNGYLSLRNDAIAGEDMFHDVDWKNTRAYALGFGGIFLNQSGRERDGIVAAGEEAQSLRSEIRAKLLQLRDEEKGVSCVREVYDAPRTYTGPYAAEGPDLAVGFLPGYRVSWESVTGKFLEDIISDNIRPWSGDHNFNPPDVPGMLFVNRKISTASPSIVDIGPTTLDLFGIPIPAWCDGKSIVPN